MSVAIENFVKAIYQNHKNARFDTKPGTIAKKLNVTNAAATDMAKKLALKDLVIYEKYKELNLTEKGNTMALKVVRKHRIWESVLFKLLNLSLHEIHREAELLEHQTSDFLADKLHEYLGYPDYDPHGDPIPNAEGVITTSDTSITLLNAKEDTTYHISRLQSDDKDFFDFCATHGLINGDKISVEKQLEKTHMTQVNVQGKVLLLNKEFTNIIYVK